MRRTLMLLSTMALALLLAGGVALVAVSPAARADGDCQPSGSQVVCTFTYTGAAQIWTVPEEVTQATFDVSGAQGGGSLQQDGYPGGRGGKASATIAVTPGETLQVNVGGKGGDGVVGGGAGGAGGFNGGAAGGNGGDGSGAGGGGASDVRSGAFGLANRIIVAGGGGGTGGGEGTGSGNRGGQGGFGGGVTGGPGGTEESGGGGGGTDSKGGDGGAASLPSLANGGTGALNGGTGGSGGSGASCSGGGGGGGGYYGGGGGGGACLAAGGGGGGSGFGPSGVVFQSGVRSGNGLVTITYTEPVAYTVDRSDDPNLSTIPTAGNCTAAANDCSLRGAITAANSSSGAADTIVFDLDSPATITLASSLGQLPPIKDAPPGLTIDGGDAEITVSGGGNVRVFAVDNGKKLALENLTVSGGSAEGEDPIDEFGGGAANFGGTLTISNSTFSGNSAQGTSSGGGVYTDGGTVNVTDSTFSGNSAVFGGGIYNQNSSTTVTNSTFSDNSAAFGGGGGGINNDNRSTLTVTNSTFSGNSGGAGGGIGNSGTLTVNNSTFSGNSGGAGGGIGNFGTATLKNTIVAGNSAEFGGPDVNGTFTSEGYNLIGKSDGSSGFTDGQSGDQVGTAASPLDPLLGGLDDNGGPTKTHALLAGSPAVDKGNTDLTEDQRGQPRPFDDPNVAPATEGDNSDIGSFEVQEVPNTAPDAKDDSATTSEDNSVTIHVLANDTDPESDALQITSVSTPSHGTATINNNATPSNTADDYIDYDPVDNYNGTDTFTYTISDGKGGTDTADVNVTVKPLNDTPVANDDTTTYTMAEDSNAITIDFGALVSDVETSSDADLTYDVSLDPADEAKGSLANVASDPTKRTFDSANDFNGTVDILYTVSDRGDPDNCSASPCDTRKTSAQKKVTVTVTPVNDTPSANDDSTTWSMNEDAAAISVDLRTLVSDVETNDVNLTYAIVSGPDSAKGTLNGTATNGVYSFDSANDFNGQVSFTYKVTDRGDPDNCSPVSTSCDAKQESATETVTITVKALNDAPTVVVAAVTSTSTACGTNDRSGTINLTVDDPDGPEGSLTLSATSSKAALVPTPSNVTFGGAGANRTLTATAVSGRTGTAVLTVTVTDGQQATGAPFTVNVRVGGNGKDTLVGDANSDILLGQNGDDTLSGLGGIDLLCGARGNDRLTGGTEADHFGGGSGTDTATDFNNPAGQGDTQSGIP